MNDLVLVQGIVMVLYTLTPHLGKVGSEPLTLAFGSEDGNNLHNLAITCYFLAVRVTSRMIQNRTPHQRAINLLNARAATIACAVGALFSIGLSIIYLQRFGFVLGGDMDYSETFELKQTKQEGYGILLLSIPLALSSLALALAHSKRLLSTAVLLPLLAFLMLLVVHGQRKYLIIPLIFIGFSRLRVRSISSIIAALIAIAIGWCAFCYLGFLRVENYPISRALEAPIAKQFFDQSDDYLAGETMTLTGTGSAAVQGIVQPLPYLGDYTAMWQMLVPQFLITSDFEPINVRFAYAWNQRAAAKGMGWGFDFWGEAYVVGGPVMVLLMAFAITAFFRFLYVRSNSALGSGFWGAYAVIGSYYALWFQRNGLVYLCREYLVFAAAMLLLLVVLGIIVSRLTAGTRARSEPHFSRKV